MFRSQRHANDGLHGGSHAGADVTPLPVRQPPVWGPAGYALLLTGGVAEIFGTGISLALSIPGGLPEVALGIWLCRAAGAHPNGFKTPQGARPTATCARRWSFGAARCRR